MGKKLMGGCIALAVLLAVGIFCAMRFKGLKSLHPIVFIGLSALAGILFSMG